MDLIITLRGENEDFIWNCELRLLVETAWKPDMTYHFCFEKQKKKKS